MESKRSQTNVLRAALYEVERGLFQVSYRTDTARRAVHELPIYQTGTCAREAKQRIDESAQECGFDLVIWDGTPGAPNETALPIAGTSAGC
ncbi:MAG: hypothetical protein ABSC06_06635 [Rhodopila sp.]|jgi:hypothetical protein